MKLASHASYMNLKQMCALAGVGSTSNNKANNVVSVDSIHFESVTGSRLAPIIQFVGFLFKALTADLLQVSL